jgi:hypothetical protein
MAGIVRVGQRALRHAESWRSSSGRSVAARESLRGRPAPLHGRRPGACPARWCSGHGAGNDAAVPQCPERPSSLHPPVSAGRPHESDGYRPRFGFRGRQRLAGSWNQAIALRAIVAHHRASRRADDGRGSTAACGAVHRPEAGWETRA